ncbi:hypothetical protein CNYM01_02118 [Colletotrichum nymphaeae SA-01]|uniref:Uncharacterized protein n=1 Tax=Colletotrichum nymphaeae SA-01 TaxID=1460502 RepID=A0A135S443_9PEZI|nr:hypothetical protein CNYM01_02118 [Colletotrichum nymphaeae SA-01]
MASRQSNVLGRLVNDQVQYSFIPHHPIKFGPGLHLSIQSSFPFHIDRKMHHVAFFGATGCKASLLEMLDDADDFQTEYLRRMTVVTADLTPETAAKVLFPEDLRGEPEISAGEGDKCDVYISEAGICHIFDALRMRFAASPPKRKPRLISVGSLSIDEQIDDTSDQLATEVRPLYLWFMGMVSEEVDDNEMFLRELPYGSEGSDTSSYDSSSECDPSSSLHSSMSSFSSRDWDQPKVNFPPRTPYDDKMEMEYTIGDECNKELYSSSLIVRPTLLTYTKPCGVEAVRVGREGNPPPGWTISRFDAGHWLYQYVPIHLRGNAVGRSQLNGQQTLARRPSWATPATNLQLGTSRISPSHTKSAQLYGLAIRTVDWARLPATVNG